MLATLVVVGVATAAATGVALIRGGGGGGHGHGGDADSDSDEGGHGHGGGSEPGADSLGTADPGPTDSRLNPDDAESGHAHGAEDPGGHGEDRPTAVSPREVVLPEPWPPPSEHSHGREPVRPREPQGHVHPSREPERAGDHDHH